MKKATKKQIVEFMVKLTSEGRRKQLNSMSKERLTNVILKSNKIEAFNNFIEEDNWLTMIYKEDDTSFTK